MRVTESKMKLMSLSAMKAAESDNAEAQFKLASGKEVYKPSDDPLRFVSAARFKAAVRNHEQYLRNISDSQRFLENNESAVGKIVSLLQETRMLMVRAGNETFTTSDLRLMADEMRQQLDGLIQLANSKTVDGSIFGGTKTDADPFEVKRDANGVITDVIYRGNTAAMKRAIAENSAIDVNYIGSEMFQVDPDRKDSTATTSVNTIDYPGATLDGFFTTADPTTGWFTVQGERVYYDISSDSILDIADRINDKVGAVTATVEGSLLGTAPVASDTAALGANAGTIQINGVSITLGASASITDVANAINAVSGDTGVTASVESVTGGFALQVDGGVEINDTDGGSSNALQILGVTSGVPGPGNLQSQNPLDYRLRIETDNEDQLILDDENDARFLERLGMTDGTSNSPANMGAGPEEDLSLFGVLIQAIDNLENGDFAAIRDGRIAELSRGLDRMDKLMGENGALAARLQNTEEREKDIIMLAKQSISESEELDYAEAISNLRMAQYKLQTAIGAAENIPGQNLANFL